MKSDASPSSPCNDDDGASFAAVDHVERGALDVHVTAIDVRWLRCAIAGRRQERDDGRAAGDDDGQTQKPSRHRLLPGRGRALRCKGIRYRVFRCHVNRGPAIA